MNGVWYTGSRISLCFQLCFSDCRAQIQRDLKKAEYNPANFGDGRKGRLCICEVPGQVPCPSKVPLGEVKHSWHDTKEESAV